MPGTPSRSELFEAANAAYSPGTVPSGMTPALNSSGVPLVDSDPSTGLYAAAFKDSAGNIVIAYQGTRPASSIPQDLADAAIFQGQSPPALSEAVAFATAVQEYAAGAPIYVTGHSLGGIEAEDAAESLGLSGASFGASGLPQYSGPTGSTTAFINYVDYGDPVGNYASDSYSALHGIAPSGMNHYGTVEMVGSPSDAQGLTNAQTLLTQPNTGDIFAGWGMLAGQLQYHLRTNYNTDLGNPLLSPISEETTPLDLYGVPLGSPGSAQPQLIQLGSNQTFNGGATAVQILVGGSNAVLNVSNSIVYGLEGSSFNLAGGDDAIGLGGSSFLRLLGGSGYIVNNDVSGDTVSTDTSATINGTGGLIDTSGSGFTVTASGETIDAASGTSFNTAGGNDTFYLATNCSVGLLGGAGYLVSGTADTINTLGGTSVNVCGSDDGIVLGGTGSTLGLLGGTGYTVLASNSTLQALPGTSVDVSGNDDGIVLGGTGSTLGLVGGTGFTILASGSSIQALGGISITLNLNGTGNSFNGAAVGAGVTSGIFETITTNSDGSWVDHLVNVGNGQVAWTEEQFVHAANNQPAEETVNYENGNHTVQYWDVYSKTEWDTDIKQYNPAGSLTQDSIFNHDGSSAITYINPSGTGANVTYFYKPGQSGTNWTAWVGTGPSGATIMSSGDWEQFLLPGGSITPTGQAPGRPEGTLEAMWG